MRDPIIGEMVLFTDSKRQVHQSLVTWVHGSLENCGYMPSINLVYVSGDERQEDPYGRQITRETSVVHVEQNSAGANGYSLPG